MDASPQPKAPEQTAMTFERVLRILRRRKLIIIGCAVLLPVLVFLFSSAKQKEYTATATLLFQTEEGSSAESAAREAVTNNELVGLPVVAVRASKDLGGKIAAGDILDSISVEAGEGNSDIGKVESTTTSPDESARIANAYARAYIDFRRETDQSQIQQAINVVEQTLDELPGAEAENGQRTRLEERLNSLKVEQALQTGKAVLVQTAAVPSSPSSPKTKRNVLVGFVVGLLLGLVLAGLLERFDTRIRTPEEMGEDFGLPLLARVPRSKILRRGRLGVGPDPSFGEAMRMLRANLRYFHVDRPSKLYLLTSAAAGDGKSLIASELAASLAERGDRVVLVEADLRKGGEVRQVDGRDAPGLSGALVGVPLSSVLVQLSLTTAESGSDSRMWVLPSGHTPPNPAELLDSARMKDVLSELQEQFDAVVVDTPALGSVADALSLIPLASAVLVIAALGKTTRAEAADLRRQLALQDVARAGLVINLSEPERSGDSYYTSRRVNRRG